MIRLRTTRVFSLLFMGYLFFLLTAVAQGGVYDPSPSFEDPHHVCCMEPHPVASFAARPDCRCESLRSGRRFHVRFNKAGLRGPDYSKKPSRGVPRILLMGGSSFMGPGIEEKFTPAQQLQSIFLAHGRKVEVINAAVEGYSTFQLALRLREWTEQYSPDIVLFYLNGQSLMLDWLQVEASPASADGMPSRLNQDAVSQMSPLVRQLLGGRPDARPWRIVSTFLFFAKRWHFSRLLAGIESQEERVRKWSAATMSILTKAQRFSEEKKFKFVVFFNDYPKISNNLIVTLDFDFATANLVDRVTPAVVASRSVIKKILDENKFRNFSVSFPGHASFHLGGDYHFNEAGARYLANELYKQRSFYLK